MPRVRSPRQADPAGSIGFAMERLRTLGVYPDTPESPNSVRENAEIFERCATMSDIRKDIASKHWALGTEQFVYFHLNALFEKDPEYKSGFLAEAKKELGSLGIPPEHIDEYFKGGVEASLLFTFQHAGRYNWEVRRPFYEKADQFALDKMRQWLGFQTG